MPRFHLLGDKIHCGSSFYLLPASSFLTGLYERLCFLQYSFYPQKGQEHPTSCSAEKLFYCGYFAGKIDPVLCVAGKMKYICWETFLANFLLNGHYRREAEKICFRTLDNL